MRRNLRSTAAVAAAALAAVMAGSGIASAASDGPVEAGITVPKVEGLAADFMNGVDASSILSLEESGVTFTGFDGAPADLFDVMADAGVNYARIRVWNHPFLSTDPTKGYGGGNVDAARATEIGLRATAAGMRVFVDFHYADFWAHPGQQPVPKSWTGMTAVQKASALYDYTAQTLSDMQAAGVDVGMVQIGNETSNLQLSGENWPASAPLFDAGTRAVRDTLPDAKVAIHFTNPERGNYGTYARQLSDAGIDYDVFASSYYAFWHGTLENLTAQLAGVADTYGKEVIVAETSWNYTLEDGDGHTNTIRASTASDKYSSSVQGQALAVRDVIEAVANVGQAGLGVFYWEPAWIPVGPPSELENNKRLWEQYGSGWASSYAGEYDPRDAGVWYGGSAWDNQALFDFEGRPLESLRVFQYARTGAVAPREVDAVQSPSITVNEGDPIPLPATVTVSYTDGSSEEQSVQWAGSTSWIVGPGTYRYHGTTAAGLAAVARVTLIPAGVSGENQVVNPGFEAGVAPWTGTGSGYTIGATDDPYEGTRSTHFYSANAFSFTISQQIIGVPAGSYRLTAAAQGRGKAAGETAYITAASGIASVSADIALAGWRTWQRPRTAVLEVVEGATVTVSATFSLTAGAWGTIDAFELVAEAPAVEADTAALEALVAEAEALDRGGYTAVSLLRVDRALARAAFVLDAPAPSQGSADAAAAQLEDAMGALEEGDGSIPEPTVRPVELTVVDGDPLGLPATVTLVAYDDSTSTEPVTWSDAADWIAGPGTYTVSGRTERGRDATATITVVERNWVLNPGFEKGPGDVTPWTLEAAPWPADGGAFWVAASGDAIDAHALNFYSNLLPFSFTGTQAVSEMPAGTYRLEASAMGADTTLADASVELVATVAGQEQSAPLRLLGWPNWDRAGLDLVVAHGDAVSVGVRGQAGSGDWGWIDAFTLIRTDVSDADTTALADAVGRADAVVREGHTEESIAALDRAVEIARVVLAASRAGQDRVDAATALVEQALAALVTPAPTCEVVYRASGESPKGGNATVWITNLTAQDIDGWVLEWEFAAGEKVTRMHRGYFTQEGATVTAINAHSNGLIRAGKTVNLHLVADRGDGPAPLASASLNGAACAVTP